MRFREGPWREVEREAGRKVERERSWVWVKGLQLCVCVCVCVCE